MLSQSGGRKCLRENTVNCGFPIRTGHRLAINPSVDLEIHRDINNLQEQQKNFPVDPEIHRDIKHLSTEILIEFLLHIQLIVLDTSRSPLLCPRKVFNGSDRLFTT